MLHPYRLPRALGNIELIFMRVGLLPYLNLVNSGSLHTHCVLNSYFLYPERLQHTVPILSIYLAEANMIFLVLNTKYTIHRFIGNINHINWWHQWPCRRCKWHISVCIEITDLTISVVLQAFGAIIFVTVFNLEECSYLHMVSSQYTHALSYIVYHTID